LATDLDTPLDRLSWSVRATSGVHARIDGGPEPILRVGAMVPGVGRIDLEVADPEGNSSAVSISLQIIAPEGSEPETSDAKTGPDTSKLGFPSLESVSVDTIATAVLARSRSQDSGGRHTAYPNPFNAGVVLGYFVTAETPVRLAIYDGQGRHVRTLVDREQAAGRWQAVWDGRTADGDEAASGVYLYQGDAGPEHWRGKVLLLR
jgi:hypothetical protein